MVTIVFEFSGVTAAQYDEACRLAGCSQANVPDGLIFHSASPTDNGWLVVDVWDSEEKFQAFGAQLGPAMQQCGISGSPRILKTHYIMGTAAPAAA